MKLYQRIEQVLGLDLRSLALYRMLLGVLILLDLSVRAGDLTAHYSDLGVLPRSLLYELAERPLYLSIHLLSGSPVFQGVLFVMAALAAIALLVGYRTQVAVVVSWGLMLSLHVRNPYVLNSGDSIFLLLLFWGMFLPLHAYWSVDARQGRAPVFETKQVFSIATLALILQVCFIYWFSVVWKSDPVWLEEFSALYYALSLDRLATPLGHWLLHTSPDILKALTIGTLFWEAVGPALVFSPLFRGPLRTVACFGFIGFHLGLAMTMELGLFPYVCMAAWIGILPGWFWQQVDVVAERLSHRLPQRIRALAPRIPLARWLPVPQKAHAVVPSPIGFVASNLLAGIVLIYIFAYNFHSIAWVGATSGPAFEQVTEVGKVFKLNQVWRMFAKRPAIEDGWYVMVGTTRTGEQIDVFQNSKIIAWDKPVHVSRSYQNQRWRKFLGERVLAHQETLAPALATYLWRNWNATHPADQQLQSLEIYQMYEENLPHFAYFPPEKRLLSAIDGGTIRFVAAPVQPQ